MGVDGEGHTQAALPPGMTWYILYRRLGGPCDWCGWVREIFPLLEFNLQIIQPIVKYCTDYAVLACGMSW